MAAQRPSVLVFPRDVILLRHLLGRLPHRLAGGRLGDGGRDGNQVAWSDLREGFDARAQRPGLTRLHQDVRQPARGEDRNVRQRFGAACNHDVRVAECDLVVGGADCLIGRGAGAIQGVCGDFLGKLRQQADFAPDVRYQRRRHDLAKHDLVDLIPVQVGALQQLARRIAGEVDGTHILERRAGFAERCPDAGDYRHAPTVETGH